MGSYDPGPTRALLLFVIRSTSVRPLSGAHAVMARVVRGGKRS